MKSKDEVISKFKEFITLVESQTNKKIKVFRSDNGLEYCNQEIRNMLTSMGIKHERTNTYSPQMNGVAERYNRTLLEGVRAYLQSTKLPHYHRIEAIIAINYLRNRTLHKTAKCIPFQRWYGQKPTVKHLRRLGCIAFVHLPQNKRNKLQPRAKKGILVGYGLGTSGYRIWFPGENLIVESKNVTFDEAKMGNEIIPVEVHSPQRPNHITDWEIDEEMKNPQTSTLDANNRESEHSRDSDNVSSEDDSDDDRITFTRMWKERKHGATKGRLDIYYRTSDGTTLRSRNDAQKYCEENKLRYNIDNFNFSTADKAMHKLKFKKVECTDESEEKEATNDHLEKENPEEECSCGEVLGEIYCTDIQIPKSVAQAKKLPEAEKWQKAMDAEIQTMKDHEVWSLIQKPENVKVIGSRWVFTGKRNAEGHIASYKARLVALGNKQIKGKDYEETYSPVTNFLLIRLFILLFIVMLGWKHCVLDVKCAYLYGKIDKDLYLKQPTGYEVKGKETYVLKLHKAIYGLHQSGRCWYTQLHENLLKAGFTEVSGMVCVYKDKAVVQVYVDDIPIYAKNDETLQEVVHIIKGIYDVKNLGPINQLLGVKFDCTDKGAFISQSNYILKLIKKFNYDIFCKTYIPLAPGVVPNMTECPKTNQEKFFMQSIPYRSLLGSLMYIASRSRPDIAYSVASLSQFCENPGKTHWEKLKGILYYLASTQNLGIEYLPNDLPLQLTVYADANWASDPAHRRSWSGYYMFLGGMPFAM